LIEELILVKRVPMLTFSAFPSVFVTLLLASPIFSAPTSPNDAFRAIAIHVQRQPDPPVCCLTPLPPLEPVEDEVLLSFEEWKAKRFAMEAQAKAKAKEKDSTNRSSHVQGVDGTGGTGGQKGSEMFPIPSPVPVSPSSGHLSTSQHAPESMPDEPLSPHFRVPLTDRFNYAGLDCSARVHTSHHSAKSPSSILSSKRDKYMLSPCTSSKEKQFVVVELCEDIRIDTVQLANFEFFSGVFKEFTVSVAKTYTEGWTVAGTYKAKNVRGVQVRLQYSFSSQQVDLKCAPLKFPSATDLYSLSIPQHLYVTSIVTSASTFNHTMAMSTIVPFLSSAFTD
jgi:hypothetical protein